MRIRIYRSLHKCRQMQKGMGSGMLFMSTTCIEMADCEKSKDDGLQVPLLRTLVLTDLMWCNNDI